MCILCTFPIYGRKGLPDYGTRQNAIIEHCRTLLDDYLLGMVDQFESFITARWSSNLSGMRNEDVDASTVFLCNKCGYPCSPDFIYCPKCGRRFRDASNGPSKLSRWLGKIFVLV